MAYDWRPMAKQNTPIEERAWEIFVQLLGKGARPADAVTEAFSAVQVFDNHSDHLKEAKRKSAKQARSRGKRHSE
jgi:hypothetical protein